MSRVICLPQQMLPRDLERGAAYYSMYTASQRQDVGSVGTGLLDDLELKGIYPSLPAWDFATFALAVGASSVPTAQTDGHASLNWRWPYRILSPSAHVSETLKRCFVF